MHNNIQAIGIIIIIRKYKHIKILGAFERKSPLGFQGIILPLFRIFQVRLVLDWGGSPSSDPTFNIIFCLMKLCNLKNIYKMCLLVFTFANILFFAYIFLIFSHYLQCKFFFFQKLNFKISGSSMKNQNCILYKYCKLYSIYQLPIILFVYFLDICRLQAFVAYCVINVCQCLESCPSWT